MTAGERARMALLALLALLPCGACVEVTQFVPPAAAALETVPASASEAADAERPFVGLVLEEQVAGSLDAMEFLAGLRVASVAAGSPAERAGIRAGDVVIAADGAPLESLDQWRALLDGASVGDALRLIVERGRGESDVVLQVAGRGDVGLPPPRRFAERRKARFVAETVQLGAVGEGGAQRFGARIVALLEESALADAGLGAGDVVVAVDGEAIGGAADLVRAIDRRAFGDEIELDLLDAAAAAPAAARTVEVDLAELPSRLTKLAVPILFSFERDLAAGSTTFALVDLWVIALYDYRRQLHTRRHRILRFFEFETGTGELAEVGREDAAREDA